MVQRTWEDVAREAQARRDACIPREWLLPQLPSNSTRNVMQVPYTSGIMTERELQLTEQDATALLEQLSKRELTSYDLTRAFCKRAAIAQQLINCLTEIFFDEALARARELDMSLSKTGKVVGPYHGLPFSIKDQINIRGKRSTSGFVSRVDCIAEDDAATVGILRASGAVFYCKTTTCQTMMHLESHSNLHGRTLNPFNRMLTCGGSSGGEGALVGFRGSPIGLGADGGGSIRSPAANQGVYGMKTTSGRVPTANGTRPMYGCESFPVVVGPLCRSARDFEFFQQVMSDSEPWRRQPAMVPIPWRRQSTPSRLTIGVFDDDGVCRPHPPVTAAMRQVCDRLERSPDIKCVKWTPFHHDEGYDIVRRLFFQEGGATMHKLMAESGEPPLVLTDWVLKPPQAARRSIEETWALNVEREEYRRKYLEYWNAHPDVDVLMCPVGPGVAPKHDTARYWGYTAVLNCLDWPAVSFPIRKVVVPREHPVDTSYRPRDNEFDRYNWENYRPNDYEGAPISLQLVGRKWHCEQTMAALRKIEEVLELYE